jgi:hypothetical protein
MSAISVRRELRRHCYRWYAYRRVDGKLHKRYVMMSRVAVGHCRGLAVLLTLF